MCAWASSLGWTGDAIYLPGTFGGEFHQARWMSSSDIRVLCRSCLTWALRSLCGFIVSFGSVGSVVRMGTCWSKFVACYLGILFALWSGLGHILGNQLVRFWSSVDEFYERAYLVWLVSWSNLVNWSAGQIGVTPLGLDMTGLRPRVDLVVV
jgi:hypothetical protein